MLLRNQSTGTASGAERWQSRRSVLRFVGFVAMSVIGATSTGCALTVPKPSGKQTLAAPPSSRLATPLSSGHVTVHPSATAVADLQLAAIQSAAKPLAGSILKVLSFTSPYTDAIKAQLDDFQNLTGVSVLLDVLPEEASTRKAINELADGLNAHDVVQIDSGLIPQFARAKTIASLDSLINDSTLTDQAVLKTDDYFKAAWESNRWRNQQYGLPSLAGTQILYYRKDLLQKYGVTPPDTFDDLLTVAKKVHRPEVAAFAIRASRDQAGASWTFPMFYLGFGANWFKKFPTDMHPTLDSPEGIQACAYWVDLLARYGISNEPNSTYEDVLTAFSQGKVALAIESASLATRLLDPKHSSVANQTGLSLIPRGVAGRFPPFAGHSWLIAAASPHCQASWLFLQWAVSPNILAKVTGAPNANNLAFPRLSAWHAPNFAQTFPFGGQDLVDVVSRSLSLANAQYRPAIPEWPQLADRLAIALNEALTGQKSPEQTMHDAQKDLLREFRSAGYFTS